MVKLVLKTWSIVVVADFSFGTSYVYVGVKLCTEIHNSIEILPMCFTLLPFPNLLIPANPVHDWRTLNWLF